MLSSNWFEVLIWNVSFPSGTVTLAEMAKSLVVVVTTSVQSTPEIGPPELRIDRSWVMGDDALGDAVRTFEPCTPVARRDGLIKAISELIAPVASNALGERELALPKGLPHAPGITLEVDEAAACRAVLTQARKLGFPELTGSTVFTEVTVKDYDYPLNELHIRLADGSWLIDECIPREAERIQVAETVVAAPPPGRRENLDLLPQLPPAMHNRIRDGVALLRLLDAHHECGLAALSWWLGGDDPGGTELLATLGVHAALGCDDAAPLQLEFTNPCLRGWPYTGARSYPEAAQGLRRLISGWFRARLAHAHDPVEAGRWALAALDILDPSDRPAAQPLIVLLEALSSMPRRSLESAPLALRLQAWSGEAEDDTTGAYRELDPVPCRRSDTPALIALLDDERPCRWWQGQWIPRRLGDNALRALGELWRFDWRDLVADDPWVAPLIRSPVIAAPSYTQAWDWRMLPWSDDLRRANAQALARWWAAHGAEGPNAPLAAYLAAVPFSSWTSLLKDAQPGELDLQVGDALALRLTPAAVSAATDEAFLNRDWAGISYAALLLPGHAGLSRRLESLPRSTLLSELCAERRFLHGDEVAFDQLMTSTLVATDTKLPDYDRTGFTSAVLSNLGLWIYRPTPARLALLRAAIARDTSFPATTVLLAHLGGGAFPVLGEESYPNAWSHRPGALAAAAALTATALADRRALSTQDLLALGKVGHREEQAEGLLACPGMRVCDWIAAQLAFKRWDVLPVFELGSALREVDQAMKQPVAVRDALIERLSTALVPVVKRLSEEAGLVPRSAPKPSDF